MNEITAITEARKLALQKATDCTTTQARCLRLGASKNSEAAGIRAEHWFQVADTLGEMIAKINRTENHE